MKLINKRDKVKGISLREDKARKLYRLHFEIKKLTWSVSFSFSERQVAIDAYKEYARRLRAGEDIRPERLREPVKDASAPKPGTVKAEGNLWLITKQKQRKAGSNHTYRGTLETHIYPALGHLRITELTREVCLDFARSLVGKVSDVTDEPISYNTRLKTIKVLSGLCQWLRDTHPKTFPANPADRLIPHIKDADEAERTKLVWTHEEVERLLAATQKHKPFWYPFLAFAIKTGTRGGEQVELQWDRDFKVPGKVHIQRQYQMHERKTLSEDTQGNIVAEKDTHASRVVPLKGRETRMVPRSPELEQILALQRTQQRAWEFKYGRPQPALTFTGPRGGRVDFSNFAKHILPKLCALAKVPSTTGFHTTRHTFASVLLYAGIPVHDVSEWLGHTDTTTTERHYKHWIRDTRRDHELIKQVAAAWGTGTR